MVIHVHKNRSDKLDLITVANKFVDGSEISLARSERFNDTERRRKNVPVKHNLCKFLLLSSDYCVDFIFFVYIYFCVILLCVYFKN